ncbi:hypothetical protein Tco_1025955 [Tanacetum coccineum]
MNLAVEYGNACEAKDDMRKAYEECNHIQQETRALIDTFLKEGSNKDYEMHNSLATSTASRRRSVKKILEEKALKEKAREEKIKQKQADDEEFFLEFGVVEQFFSVEKNRTNVETRLVNEHLYEAIKGTGFRLLDITCMSEFRADAHLS